MQAEQEEIEADLIDLSDRRYFYTDYRDIEGLAESIRSVGLITPPVLQAGQGAGYRVVAGFRRTMACINLGLRQIPARVLPARQEALHCLRLAVSDNAQARPLTLGEQLRLVGKLLVFCESRDAVRAVAQEPGFCIPGELVEKLIRVSALPEALAKGVEKSYISLNAAIGMESLEPLSAEAVAGVFELLRPSVSQQKEILEGLKDLAGRNSVMIHEMLGNRRFSDILHSQQLDRGRKLQLFRREIFRRRYPVLSRAEAEFCRRRKNLEMDENMDLKPPQNFEGTTYTIIVRFSSAPQLCGYAQTLGRICRHPDLEAILKREIEDPEDLY